MRYVAGRIIAVAAAAIVAGAISLVAAQPASAHTVDNGVIKRRGSDGTFCIYTYYSSHTKASTKKGTGSCTGHAWVRVKTKGNRWSAWQHRKDEVVYYARPIVRSQHKTYRNDPYPRTVYH